MQKVEEHFRGQDDVHFVAVQTVFEGFGTNTPRRGLSELEGYELEIPLAQDEGDHGAGPFMRAYRTGGTPWTIIIDSKGIVRWNGFRIQPQQAVELIERLRPPAPETVEPDPSK